MSIEGIVLAGGQSRRFGSDKALAEVNGKKMIEHSVQLLKVVGLSVTVMAPAERKYGFLNCRVAQDLIPGQGPLGGIYSACKLYSQADLLVLTCDMPLVTEEIVRRLMSPEWQSFSAVVFDGEEGAMEPFPGLYRASILKQIEGQISQNIFSMQKLLEDSNQVAKLKKIGMHEFKNMNKQDEIGVESKPGAAQGECCD